MQFILNVGLGDIALAGIATGALGGGGYAIFPLIVGDDRKDFIIQWGSLAPLTSGGSIEVKLPIAFPTTAMSAVAVHDNASHWTRPTIYSVTTTSKTTLTASATVLNAGVVGGNVTRGSDITACYGRYIAIGC
ncbi:gp53-like domain-containing protein [Citrobacter amalonaticus]|nr:hypothetical protein [Citrobacter amalonaticus]